MYIADILDVCELSSIPWGKLDGCNILVTGATGLIGGCVVDILMNRTEKNYVVYASGRNEERARNRFSSYWNDSAFRFMKHEITEPLHSDIQFDYVICAACGASPFLYATDPVGIMKSNICGVDNILSYLSRQEKSRFLYVSSGEVYGEGDGQIFTEEDSGYVNPLILRACYPSAKRASETLCISYAHQYRMDVSIARPCHIYGPHFTQSDTRVYAQFIRNVLNDEDIVMKSAGEQYRSWCYVVDCASALLHILLKGENGVAYNIADPGSNVTIRQLAEIIADIGGRQVRMVIPDEIETKGFNVVKKSLFSITKLKSLGWQISGDFHSKLQSTINEMKQSR